MKKVSNWLKKTFSDKKTINHHQDSSQKSGMHMHLKEQWTNLMDSPRKKLSQGASNLVRMIQTRGGSNSKISGKEANKGHKEANNMHNLKKK